MHRLRGPGDQRAILVRDLARLYQNARRTSPSSSHWASKLIASLGAWFILWAVTHLLHFSTEQRYLTLCLGIVVVGQTLAEYFGALLNGIEEMGWEATLKVLTRALSVAWAFYSLAKKDPLPVIAMHMAVGTAAGYIASVWIIRNRFGSFGIKMDRLYLKQLVLASLRDFRLGALFGFFMTARMSCCSIIFIFPSATSVCLSRR